MKPTQADFQLAREWAEAMQYEAPYRVPAVLGYAHGLAAERERAAKIAMDSPGSVCIIDGNGNLTTSTAGIAAAIRKGTP